MVIAVRFLVPLRFEYYSVISLFCFELVGRNIHSMSIDSQEGSRNKLNLKRMNCEIIILCVLQV